MRYEKARQESIVRKFFLEKTVKTTTAKANKDRNETLLAKWPLENFVRNSAVKVLSKQLCFRKFLKKKYHKTAVKKKSKIALEFRLYLIASQNLPYKIVSLYCQWSFSENNCIKFFVTKSARQSAARKSAKLLSDGERIKTLSRNYHSKVLFKTPLNHTYRKKNVLKHTSEEGTYQNVVWINDKKSLSRDDRKGMLAKIFHFKGAVQNTVTNFYPESTQFQNFSRKYCMKTFSNLRFKNAMEKRSYRNAAHGYIVKKFCPDQQIPSQDRSVSKCLSKKATRICCTKIPAEIDLKKDRIETLEKKSPYKIVARNNAKQLLLKTDLVKKLVKNSL